MLKLAVFKKFLEASSPAISVPKVQILCDRATHLQGIEFDSRKVKAQQAFLALPGEKSDGHLYLVQAYQAGARVFIVQQNQIEKCEILSSKSDITIVAVSDTLAFFQQLAAFERGFWDFPVLAIAGSNGKTTTKNFCLQLFSHFFKVGGTYKNFNNHIGVPYSMLNLVDGAQVGIFELGMNHPGEVKFLCEILRPTVGGVVSVGEEHLEFFKNLDEVAAAEFELYDYLSIQKGPWICSRQIEYWSQYENKWPPRQLGEQPKYTCDLLEKIPSLTQVGQPNWLGIIRLKDLETNVPVGQMFCRVYRGAQSRDCVVPFTGEYNLSNLGFALTALFAMGVDPINACGHVQGLKLPEFRNQLEVYQNNHYLLDCYNANPSSVIAGVTNFRLNHSAPNKAIILGDMFELGQHSDLKHQEIINFVLEHAAQFKWVLFVGQNFKKASLNVSQLQNYPSILFMDTALSTRDWILKNKITAETIFVKGSRGMALERIVEKNYHSQET